MGMRKEEQVNMDLNLQVDSTKAKDCVSTDMGWDTREKMTHSYP